MAYIDNAPRVAESTVTTGTGALALAGAYDASHQRFSAEMSVSDTCPYFLVADDDQWEHGLGTYSAANELTRTTVYASSNADAACTLTAGTKVVFLGDPGVARSLLFAASKATPVDADRLPLMDSAASNVLKHLTWANVKATVKAYYDGVAATLTNKTIALGSNTVSGTTAEFNAALSDGDFATGGGTASGTNTGDQTSIVGITGTTAQFNTALTDGDFATLAGTESLTGKTLVNFGETVYAVSDAAGVAISPTNGSIQTWTLGASRTPTLGTWAAGQSMTLMVADGSAYAVTWTTMGVVWIAATAPTLPTSGYAVIELWKVGTTIYGADVGDVA